MVSVGQLPQTSYHSLHTPYAFLGLGRTNNYIENLFVGSTKHIQEHFINMEGVIPNSRVVIHPPPGKDEGSWKRELYLRPGEWIPWVMLTVIITTAILATIVFVLHLNEKVGTRRSGRRIRGANCVRFFREKTNWREGEYRTILISMHCDGRVLSMYGV